MMQTTSCTWPYAVPIVEDPAAHGHWCTFTDLYHTIPYHHTNDHGWLFKRSPRFTNGMYWEAGLFLLDPLHRRGATE